jgi:hypothetical protein
VKTRQKFTETRPFKAIDTEIGWKVDRGALNISLKFDRDIFNRSGAMTM